MLWPLLVLLLVYKASGAISVPSPGLVTDYTTTDLTDIGWSECFSFSHGNPGPTIPEVLAVCNGTSLFLGCRVPGGQELIVGNGGAKSGPVFDNVFDHPSRWFYDPSSPGIWGFSRNDTAAPSNCLLASGSETLCWGMDYENITVGGFCGPGGFLTTNVAERVIFSNPCDGKNTGDPCTPAEGLCSSGDTCSAGGICGGGTPTNCSAPNQCTESIDCERSTGACVPTYKNPGEPCDDGDPCTVSEQCDGGGNCPPGQPVVCPTPPQCKVNLGCNSGTGICELANAPDGSSCSDFDPCTLGDTCQGGVCQSGTPKTCAIQTCKQPGSCNTVTGQCEYPNLPDTTPCTSPNLCATSSQCFSGACVPQTFVSCTAAGSCFNSGTCQPLTGLCDTPPKPQGTPCDDGNPCTIGELCNSNGNCINGFIPASTTCPASDDCHLPGTPIPINSTYCGCTDPPAFDGTPCEDGDICSIGDQCLSGSCMPGPSDPCTPDNICRVGSGTCTPFVGCSNDLPDGASCDDGDVCTLNTVCWVGDCTNGTIDANNLDCDSASELVWFLMDLFV